MRLDRRLTALAPALVIATLAAAPWLGATAHAQTGTSADLAPADCIFFTNLLKGKEQFEAVKNSAAVRKVLALPLVQQGLAAAWAEMQEEDEFQQFLQVYRSPLVQNEILPAVIDIADDDFFMYGDANWIEFLIWSQELNARQYPFMMQAIASGREPDDDAMFREVIMPTILARGDDFPVPGVVIGGKVDNPGRVLELLGQLDELVQEQAPAEMQLRREKADEGQLWVLELTGEMIPESDEKMVGEMVDEGFPEEDAKKVVAMLRKQTLTAAIGIKKGYFVVSFGKDLSPLDSFGGGEGLAASDEFAPALKHTDGNVLGYGFVSKDLAESQAFDAQEATDFILKSMDPVRDLLAPALVEKLENDIPALMEDIESLIPQPRAVVSVTLGNRGLESYTYGMSTVELTPDNTELEILKRSGGSPVALVAQNESDMAPIYAGVTKWLSKFYGYAQEYGMKQLPPDQQQLVALAQDIAVPFLKKVDDATRNKLLPSLGAGQGLWLFDLDLELQQVSPFVPPFSKKAPIPEFARVRTLKDGKLFVEAWSDYAAAIDELIPRVAELSGQDIPLRQLPRPTSTPYGEGEMYFYPITGFLDSNLLPHAVVQEDLLILSTSVPQAKRVFRAGEMPEGDVIGLSEPALVVMHADPPTFFAALRTWLDIGLEMAPDSPLKQGPPQLAEVYGEHAAAIVEFLSCYKSFASRSYVEDGRIVTHAWFQVEDTE